MLSVAVAALHEREPERLWPLLAGTLPEVCGGEALIYKLDEWTESGGTVGLSPGVAAEFALLGEEAMGLLRAGYPFADHYAKGYDRAPVTARRAAGPAWSASPTASLIGDIMDADHVLGIPLPQRATPITGCLIYRSGTDFTDDHVRMAQLLQPLLAAVDQQRQLLERWQRLVVPNAAPSTADERAAACDLTPRETTVLLLLTDALTATAIGRRLGISERTVHKHIENIYRKLGTRDRISTVLRAQQMGLVPTPSASHHQRSKAQK
ncbi:LuxR C-terminal-related transcriptional regulator [Streptomyces yaanensis]|uniref:LuxR C-terminal-related transcriptional regulator n=1 Tax=Streptomyces yaanensis TaxID=1142239 RepID=A0ABV7S696_9ACTN|nr:LuxR C-terminal-related transcriptional regulator [Streptomyces sp. CGMCC 4.7035]WNC03136.1 LuxR C-terminal-related transcriptional regulator [Streptomyces sp. CGMCC 4.7035]